ncbi:NAD-dependent epimerase/dehydratase family protein [Bdellovibrionota bacterium FG-2]
MTTKTEKKILITGAAGFIAGHTALKFFENGLSVIGVDNFDPFYARKDKEANLVELEKAAIRFGVGFQFFEQDIVDLQADFLRDENIDAVVHLAAKAGVRPSLEDPEAYLNVNILGTTRLLEFCKKKGISKFLFGSSSSVYGNDTPVPFSETAPASCPISPYGASKRAGELYCSTYSTLYRITTPVLRFFTVYGPRQRPDLAIRKFCTLITSGQPIPLYGDGRTQRDYTYVSDIAAGVFSAYSWCEKVPQGSFEIFNLGGAKTTSLLQLVRYLEKALGKEAKIDWLPAQSGDVERTFSDISKASRILGYAPETSIEEGIPKFVKWFLNANP